MRRQRFWAEAECHTLSCWSDFSELDWLTASPPNLSLSQSPRMAGLRARAGYHFQPCRCPGEGHSRIELGPHWWKNCEFNHRASVPAQGKGCHPGSEILRIQTTTNLQQKRAFWMWGHSFGDICYPTHRQGCLAWSGWRVASFYKRVQRHWQISPKYIWAQLTVSKSSLGS